MKKVISVSAVAILLVTVLVISLSINKNRREQIRQTATAVNILKISSLTLAPTKIPPTATATETLMPAVTSTVTASPTPKVEALRLVTFDAVYQVSSQFTLEMTGQNGEYYGTGRVQDGRLFQYRCVFHKNIPNRLVCSGGPLPLYSNINFQVYRKESAELLFGQEVHYDFAIHGEMIPSPTGVYCEVVPIQIENKSDLQKEQSCFNVTCWQNGEALWRTDNTCQEKWPFLWDYSHPMHTPGT